MHVHEAPGMDRALRWSLGINLVFVVVEFAARYLAGSLALLPLRRLEGVILWRPARTRERRHQVLHRDQGGHVALGELGRCNLGSF